MENRGCLDAKDMQVIDMDEINVQCGPVRDKFLQFEKS